MKWVLFFFFILMQLYVLGQKEKFSKFLKDYGIALTIDPVYFTRMSYPDIEKKFSKQGFGVDQYLKEKKVEAWMIYAPTGYKLDQITDQLSVVKTIRKSDTAEVISSKKMDTISTHAKHFLTDMKTSTFDGPGYVEMYDSVTDSRIAKNLYRLVNRVLSDNHKMPTYVADKRKVFSTVQAFQKNGFLVEVEYRCYDDQADKYFPVFEKIIPTLNWKTP